MVGSGGRMGVEIKTNSAQLKLEFWLSLAIMSLKIDIKYTSKFLKNMLEIIHSM